MSVVTDLFRRLSDRRQEKRDAVADDIHQAIIVLAENGAGKNGDLDLDHYADLIESEGLDEDDLRANIAKYQQRVRWAALAPQVDALGEAAQEAEQKFIDADVAEGLRRKKAGEHLRELEAAIPRAVGRSSEAIAAHGNLIAEARVTSEERELTTKNMELNETIARLRDALNPSFHSTDRAGHSIGLGDDWANVDLYPALLAAQARRALADETVAQSAERTAKLKSRLSVAQKATESAQRELTAAEKELATIRKKQEEFNAAKLLPESFKLVRATPSRIERRKQHARKMGWHDGPADTVRTER